LTHRACGHCMSAMSQPVWTRCSQRSPNWPPNVASGIAITHRSQDALFKQRFWPEILIQGALRGGESFSRKIATAHRPKPVLEETRPPNSVANGVEQGRSSIGPWHASRVCRSRPQAQHQGLGGIITNGTSTPAHRRRQTGRPQRSKSS